MIAGCTNYQEKKKVFWKSGVLKRVKEVNLKILQSNLKIHWCQHLDPSSILAEHKVLFLYCRSSSSSVRWAMSELLPVWVGFGKHTLQPFPLPILLWKLGVIHAAILGINFHSVDAFRCHVLRSTLTWNGEAHTMFIATIKYPLCTSGLNPCA